MSVFDVYEESFKEAAEVANAYVANGEGDVTLAAAWEAVKSADEAARSMDTECAGNFELKVKVTGYKKELDSLKRDMEAVQRKKDREALLSGNTMQEGEEESADYSRVIQGQTNRIDRQGDKIAEARRIVQETEATGHQVIGNLNRQGEQMEETIENLESTNAMITSAKQLVGKLHKRVIQNKMLMYCIAAALAIMIIVLVVVSF